MRWSLKLGRILGIDVYIHITFLLLLGFIGLSYWMPDHSLMAAGQGMLFFIGLFACVLLHEYGHCLTARRYGIATRDITLLPIGGLARLERMPDKPVQELWVALAGPAVNVVIAAGLSVWLTATRTWVPMFDFASTDGNFAEKLLIVNLFLVGFNMLPAFPMDGGRVLRALLAMRMEYARATHISARIGQGMAVVFGFVGLFGNPMLMLIALFVWIGAAQEASAVDMKSTFHGVPVREAMLTDFKSITPDTILSEITHYLLTGSQRDFPVLEEGRVVGVLRHGDVFPALHEFGDRGSVAGVFSREFEAVEANEWLETAMSRAQAEKGLTMPVLESGKLVGLLTAENIGEFLMIRAALANRVVPPPLPAAARDTPEYL
jgi:Zn-dependent protease/CBS domain-containing protein